MDRDWLLTRLTEYKPADPEESRHHREIMTFVTEHSQFHDRSCPQGHVTGSAWVINNSHTHALLLHHKKLNRWLQPGGHIEDDRSVLDTALREAYEESGLTKLLLASESIFDVDIHYIPARKAEAGHLHYDIRFLLMAGDESQPRVSSESRDGRWFSPEEIIALNEGPSINRMVEKMKLFTS